MARKYSNRNKIKFTSISDKYEVQKAYKGNISKMHAALITYVVDHFKDTKKYKQLVVDALNILTYSQYAGEPLPRNWMPKNPLDNIPDIDEDLIEETLGDIYLTVDAIDWDVTPNYSESSATECATKISNEGAIGSKDDEEKKKPGKLSAYKPSYNNQSSSRSRDSNVSDTQGTNPCPTNKQDLYIQPPSVPQFDYNKPWIRGVDGADTLVIHTTLPEIPTKQNEISVTTDVTKMTTTELMKLYPNRIIHTRASIMYEPLKGVELDPDLGLILPIDGFSREEIIDNIIRYPHIFKLLRNVDNTYYSFYSHIEIGGDLRGTLDIWNDLPESEILPRQAEFVKEYVVRRYLLERDVKHIEHKYPIHGSLDPFLTLFMTPSDYIRRGYTDVEEIVKKCVLSRVSYKQSRNPVLRRLNYV